MRFLNDGTRRYGGRFGWSWAVLRNRSDQQFAAADPGERVPKDAVECHTRLLLPFACLGIDDKQFECPCSGIGNGDVLAVGAPDGILEPRVGWNTNFRCLAGWKGFHA